jgi:hypothetical protein
MKRDSRPVSQQVLSGFKIGAVILAIGAVVLICYALIPAHRIEAFVWHLRYGNTVDFGQYRLPAPKYWYVQRNTDVVLMVDLNDGDTMWVWTNELQKVHPLSAWSNFVNRASTTSEKRTIGQRDFQISGEMFRCIEQDFDLGPQLGHIYPIQCLSDGGLEVHFQSDPGVPREHYATFYSLLQKTQKL